MDGDADKSNKNVGAHVKNRDTSRIPAGYLAEEQG